MRVLHMDAGREMRGGQWQALRLAEGLREAGHEGVFLARAHGPLIAEARRRGLEARPLRLLELCALGRFADIVHAHDAWSHTLAALAGDGRLVVSRRVAFAPGSGPVSRWKYGHAAHYIAVSEFVKRRLVEAGVPSSKIAVVYDGVPMQPEAAGHEILAPDSSDPAKGAALVRKASRLGGFEVCFTHDLEVDLQRARLFLYSTHSEGLGSAALAAMAAGVPVIASRVGGLPEIIEHERTGLLTENTAQAIADAVSRLWNDRAFAQELGRRARAAVAERFSAARMVADTIRVYQSLL